ncbi:MAG TPA: efflux transporter outer membrane subunit [Kofleriaceae bacterium]|nr:efflux transporter outer membrane subunit [Kofleriaceae bacterium]
MRRALALALASCLLASCTSMAPKYERPAAPVPAQFSGVLGPSAAETAKLTVDQFVRDPKLRTIIQRAIVHNRDLRAAVQAIEVARYQYRIQRAQALPPIDAVLGVSSSRSIFPPGNSAARFDSYSVTAGTSGWEIDVWGRLKSLADAREHNYLSIVEQAKAARVSLIAELSTAYIALAADRSRLAIARETAELARKTMELTEQLVSGGTSNRGDFFQASTVYQQARSDVALYTAAIAQDKNALDLLAGAPVPDELLPAELSPATDTFADVPVGLSSAVLLGRPDVRAAEHQLISANANIGEARARFFPTLSLTANGGLASLALKALFSGPAAVFSVAPNLALPLFRGGANRANLALTKAQKLQLLAVYEGTIQRAFREVADALAVRGTIEERLAAQAELVEASTKSVELAQARYKGGVEPFLTTLVSQRALYAAQYSLVSTQLTALVNRVTLYRVLGGDER